AVGYGFGGGWYVAVPRPDAALGVARQVLVDVRPTARAELVNDSIAAFERLWDELQAEAGRELRPLPDAVRDVSELEERLGILYVAPRDARATGLPAESVDFVSSTDVCEHVPADDLAAIFR